ncbi:glycosyltransferase family 2 protein [Vibrio rumoiensis]|uniref:Glycosyltransferase family 2 protein n=1 Tax=Vibrio rumoiensis TaxID=76258 RepID=A0ABW7IUP6_9VIBR
MSLVSVIIPTYGRSSKISEAIESVLLQTHREIEIIVVDDNGLGSDNQKETETSLANYIDKINYLVLKNNLGGGLARNEGIKHALGEYVTFLDDDDTYLPHKVEEQLSAFRDNLNLDLVATGANIVSNGIIIREHFPSGKDKKDFVLNGGVMTPMMMLRRKYIIENDLGFLDTPRYQDHTFFLRLLMLNVRYKFVNKVGYNHSVHEGDKISNSPKSIRALPVLFKLEDEILKDCTLNSKELKYFSLKRKSLEFDFITCQENRFTISNIYFVIRLFIFSLGSKFFKMNLSTLIKFILGYRFHHNIKLFYLKLIK